MKKVCLIALLGLVFFCGLVRVRIVAKENLRDLTPENAVHSVGDVEGSALAYASRSDSDSANDGAEKLRLMYDEIRNGLTQRHLNDRYAAYRNYSAKILDESYRYQTGSEINGRWTLSWYDYLFRNPLDSVFELERFTRTIHDGLNGDANDLTTTLTRMREKLDVASRTDGGIRFSKTESPEQAVEKIKQALAEARRYHNKAVATLSSGEIQKLKQDLYPTFSSENGHTIKSRSYARELCSLLLKIDRGSMHNAAESLLPLTDRELLSQLASLPEDAYPVSLMDGNKVQRISTPNGDIIIGGREDNVYRLDAMKNVICVIDLGGNDTYIEGTCDLDRPVFVIIDLEGDDTYRGTKPGIQGSSILGVSMLLDLAGDDTYRAEDLAQGATLGGVGILIDYSGNDQYTAKRRAQGSALGGIGMLIDKSGSDRYRAALWAQGFGHPGGFGVLEDSEGDDTYYLGGLYRSSYPEHPGYDAWGQGVGAGIRQVANGGIGLLLDGHGDDTYEFDYFAHGGGYWFGVGAARDFSGNDQRLGSTREAFEGGTRTEAPWQQYGNGFACHYALGFLFDDEGDDLYAGTTQGSGHAHDLSTAFLCDFAGNDIFSATGGLAQGCAAQAGIGVLFNYGGNDVYEGHSQGSASTNISFHDPNECGGNFSFLIDYGGDDRYGCGASNNSYNLRASESGFLIDRPLDPEIDE